MIVQEIRNDNVFGYVRYQGEPKPEGCSDREA